MLVLPQQTQTLQWAHDRGMKGFGPELMDVAAWGGRSLPCNLTIITDFVLLFFTPAGTPSFPDARDLLTSLLISRDVPDLRW